MAKKEATQAMLGALFKGAGRRGQMGAVGGMTGGGMGGMRGGGGSAPTPKIASFGGDPMLNPNAVINAPDKQLNAYIDDKMQQWMPTSQQKQDKVDNETLAKLLPQLAGNMTPETIQGLDTQAAGMGMSPQGRINLLGGAFGQLDAQRQRDADAAKLDAQMKLWEAQLAKTNAQIENTNARTAKTNSGNSGGASKPKKEDDDDF